MEILRITGLVLENFDFLGSAQERLFLLNKNVMPE
jgi:hypothetical protein